MPQILFGTNTCYAIKRWPEPEEWVAVARDSGITNVQFSYDLLDPWMAAGRPEEWDAVRRACGDAGITITSAFTGFIAYAQNLLGHPSDRLRAQAEEWYRLALVGAGRLGVDGAGGHMGAMSAHVFENAAERKRAIDRIVEAVLRLSEVGRQEGLRFLLWEPMPVAREYPARLEEVQDMLDRVSDAAIPVKLCLDLGHACLAGATSDERDPYHWLAQVGWAAHMIHLQQTDGQFDRHWPFTAELNANGIIDPHRVMDIVRTLPQERIELMLECVPAFETTDEQVTADLAESVEFWRPALETGTEASARA